MVQDDDLVNRRHIIRSELLLTRKQFNSPGSGDGAAPNMAGFVDGLGRDNLNTGRLGNGWYGNQGRPSMGGYGTPGAAQGQQFGMGAQVGGLNGGPGVPGAGEYVMPGVNQGQQHQAWWSNQQMSPQEQLAMLARDGHPHAPHMQSNLGFPRGYDQTLMPGAYGMTAYHTAPPRTQVLARSSMPPDMQTPAYMATEGATGADNPVAEMKRKMDEMTEKQAALEAELARLQEAQDTMALLPASKVRTARNRPLENLVHNVTKILLGMTQTNDFPSPTADPGDIPSEGFDGPWQPEWTKFVREHTSKYNAAFLARIQRGCLREEEGRTTNKPFTDLSQKGQLEAVTKYVKNLADRYKSKTNPEVGQKAKLVQERRTRYMQDKRVVSSYLMLMVKEVKKVLPPSVADEAGRGLAALLHTEWIPSCARDTSLGSPMAWQERMSAYGLGERQSMYVVKPMAWKSEKRLRIEALLFKTYNDHRGVKKPVVIPGLLEDVDTSDPRPVKGVLPSRRWISDEWLSGRPQSEEPLQIPEDDPLDTLLNLEVTDEMLGERDCKYWLRQAGQAGYTGKRS